MTVALTKAECQTAHLFYFWHGSKLGNSLMCHSEERSDEESPASGNRGSTELAEVRIEIPHPDLSESRDSE